MPYRYPKGRDPKQGQAALIAITLALAILIPLLMTITGTMP